jgi:hypothetical protein
MKIVGIESDRVQLEKQTQDGIAKYVMRFRQSAVRKE